MTRPAAVATAFAAAGAVLVVATTFWGGTPGLGLLAFVAWALVPWAILAAAGRWARDAWWTGGAGATALAAEAGIRASVFLFPTSSTSALALIFSPIAITVLLAVGAAAGALAGFAWRRGGLPARVLVVAGAACALGLLVLGFARPDLFPTTVWQRRAARERIGAPRVVTGADRFAGTAVASRGAFFQALRGPAGDDVAVIDGGTVRLLDPESFAERGTLTLGTEALGGWSWSSRLARVGGRVVVVQTGGGFQTTEVRELDGQAVWKHQPDAALPPAALRPADLDGDGEVELYGAGHTGLSRLDAAGREVWTQPGRVESLAALLPRTKASPAWIVATAYGTPARVVDEHGTLVGERALPDGAGVVGAAELAPHGRVLVLSSEERVRGMRLDGTIALDVPIRDFVATQAVPVSFDASGPGLVAVAAQTLRHEIGLGRVLLVDGAGRVVYDEILAAPVSLLTVRRADGGETLLLDAAGLRALRPKSQATAQAAHRSAVSGARS